LPTLLGPRHRAVISLKVRLAWNLFRLRRYNESESLFRDLVCFYSNGEVERDESLLAHAWLGLANVLWRTARIEEAACWYQKSFDAKNLCYGDDLLKASILCYQLGSCYEKLGRYDDALKLYRQFMDEIRESSEGSNETIAKLRSQMLLVEEQMKQCGTSSYVCDQEISGYKLDSSNQEVRAEEKVDEVGLLERERNELRKEEWMTFINEEFQTA
jgi:tetratricopeptide (TPR) repeat protein